MMPLPLLPCEPWFSCGARHFVAVEVFSLGFPSACPRREASADGAILAARAHNELRPSMLNPWVSAIWTECVKREQDLEALRIMLRIIGMCFGLTRAP